MQDKLIDKNKIIVLTETVKEADPMFNAWIDSGLHADILFAPVTSKFGRAARRLWLNGILPGASMWYGAWKNTVVNYDTVIVHASELTRTIPKWIRAQKQDIRIIYWYWNPVNEKSLPQLIDDKKTEIWSFDSDDCKKYGMNQNIQYYYDSKELAESNVEYDVYFVGHDKGRKEQLDKLAKVLEANNITYRFDVIGENKPNIPYGEIRKRISKSKAILEINQSGQIGCTLRALEALFFQKKLLTTNGAVKNEEFYNENNIYILDDKLEDIDKFMNLPFTDTTDLKKKHDIDAWIEHFYM
ncbi:MAG: hypothetical protein E7274_02595 [Pseudobutyrivibrio ruminis]|uniref:hypothetical protein n=1 Tax=Pseudobutyrivibrio ruminis TaxID=46206 RepID=UPI0026EE5F07|nr:hypothetical protein [Pseudobutyrivibrio ruminis]MBE5912932.1 hypothetical protein [Pseudobutyrivibrio ruminis]